MTLLTAIRQAFYVLVGQQRELLSTAPKCPIGKFVFRNNISLAACGLTRGGTEES